jgi:signal transduction histidine kinase
MAGGLAHDFNNLIMVIQGNATLAAQELPAQSVGRQTLQQVNKACQRAAELCRQMLAYSGEGQLRLEQVQLTSLVESLVPLLSATTAKGTELKLKFSPDLPAIRADAAQIRQIVLNLVANSVEAVSANGGIISVSTGLCECRPDDLQGVFLEEDRLAGRYVWLEVADNGCGMDVEQQRRIFEPFYTTKFVGRGVGLSAVLGIVRTHKGVLKVSSALGQGSTFRALFPAVADG